MFYFIRHGQTDYSERNTKIYQGFGVHLAKLSETGIQQIQKTAKDPRLKTASLILSSPYTRAVQTAAILSKELGIDIVIETDLHEWIANKDFIYPDDLSSDNYFSEYMKNHGKYPAGEEKPWETAEAIRKRVLQVLKKYSQYENVIITGHGLMIQAVTEKDLPSCGEIVEFSSSLLSS